MVEEIKIDWKVVKNTITEEMKNCKTEQEFEQFILKLVGGFLYANKDVLQQQDFNVDTFNEVNKLNVEKAIRTYIG
jgi:hypothetical protein